MTVQNIILAKKSDNLLTLNTAHKYVDENIQFNLNIRSAEAELNTTAETSIESTPAVSGGKNISESIGQRSESEPNSGYFIRVKANTQEALSINTSGWIETGDISAIQSDVTDFYPVNEATFIKQGSIQIQPTVEISQDNVTFSNIDNGISVSAIGGGTGTASATFAADHAGYVENKTIDRINLTDNQTSAETKFISGVSINSPVSGSNNFFIEIPNNNTTVTFTFSVDANGNAIIE